MDVGDDGREDSGMGIRAANIPISSVPPTRTYPRRCSSGALVRHAPPSGCVKRKRRPMRILTGCVMMVLCLNAALVVVCRGESLAIQNIQGIWTRQTYVETVRVTRSPFSERPETVTIQDGKFYWATYHAGAWRKIIRL